MARLTRVASPGMGDNTIGERLRTVRLARGLSLRVVAQQAGISHVYLSQIERGLRGADSLTLLGRLADALQTQVSDLLQQPTPTPGNGKTDRATDALRRALAAVELGTPGGLVVPSEVLRSRVTQAQRTRWAAQFPEVGAELPSLIRDLHTTLAAGQDVAVLLDLAVLLHVDVTYRWLRDAWAPIDLSGRVASLARQLAQDRDEINTLGVAAFGIAQSLLTAGMVDLAARALEQAPTPTEPGVRGAYLTEWARIAVTNREDPAAAMSEAAELARHTGELGLDPYGFAWGPTHVGIHHMGLHLEAGEPERALSIGRTLTPSDHAYLSRRAAYHLTVGSGLARVRGRLTEAVAAFRVAEGIMPVRVHRSPLVRDTVSTLVERSRRAAVPRELRQLAGRMGLPVE